MSPTSIVCNDAHMSVAQVSSGCCLQICLGLLSCNSSIKFLQLILHMPCTRSHRRACCHYIHGKSWAPCRQLCLSSSQCQPHRQASLSSRHSSFHSRCSSSHSLPSPALTALGRSMTMGQPQCNPRGCLPCAWDQPRPWDRQGPSLREHLLSLKVMLQLDLTWHVLK